MANNSDYEGDDDIVAHYEREGSDGEQGSFGEATSDKDDETGTARKVDPSTSKTHKVRSSVPRLNTERLKNPKGITAIENYFEGFKFYGKGHEKTDLDRIMKRLEHWSYRLFPKYHFDDFLARVEQLGTKKDLQVYIKKYRLDMINPDDDIIIHDNMDDEEDKQESAPLDDFDLLITEQIQKQKQAETRVSTSAALPSTSNEDAFDELLMQSNNILNSQSNNIPNSQSNDIPNSQSKDIPNSQSKDMPNSQIQSRNTANNELSDEIKEKIEKNKQLAIQRRLQRQKEQVEEAKKKKLLESTDIETLNENCNLTTDGRANTSWINNIQSQTNDNINKETHVDRSEEVLLDV